MINITIIAYEGMSLFHLSVPTAIFKDAVPPELSLFKLTICAESPGVIRAANGLSLLIEHDLNAIDNADIIIFPSWIPHVALSPTLLAKITQAAHEGKRVVGLCLGAYALGHAGLLDGKSATTHWKFAEQFSNQFPLIHCDTNSLYIEQGHLITSAGTAAAIDCCLFIVKLCYGAKTANQIARMMVASPERSGGQNQYIESPLQATSSDKRVAALITHMMENITEQYSLEQAANYCAMSVRSFTRVFKANHGTSFSQWLTHQRLSHSLKLLESTQLSITNIADMSGFSSEQIYRKHFKSKFDTTPTAWRQLFYQGHSIADE